jgi:(p)ppGpp synthase/HD superfamily hydrolase
MEGSNGVDGISDRQLLTMKIGVVDSNWSSDGLRAMLAATLTGFDPEARANVLRAERLASRLHADDTRSGGSPYVNHLLRVTIRIAHYYHVRDVDVLTAGLLHDAVEDHPDELADLATDAERLLGETEAALAVLGRAFSPRMAGLVRAVTNPRIDKTLDPAVRQELYRAHVVESLEAQPWARVVKLSDFTDNGVGIMWTVTPDKARRSAAKYAPLVPALIDFARRPDTPLDFEAKTRIVGQLKSAQKYFAAVLDTDD